jgi:hypothetical protein
MGVILTWIEVIVALALIGWAAIRIYEFLIGDKIKEALSRKEKAQVDLQKERIQKEMRRILDITQKTKKS